MPQAWSQLMTTTTLMPSPRCGLELLQVEAERPISGEQHHWPIRVGQLGAHGVGESGPQVPVVPGPQQRTLAPVGESQMRPQSRVAAVDGDDGVLGHPAGQLHGQATGMNGSAIQVGVGVEQSGAELLVLPCVGGSVI